MDATLIRMVAGLGLLALLGCDGSPAQEPVGAGARPAAQRKAPAAVSLRADTVLPKAFERTLPAEPQGPVVVPAGLLLVSSVVRPRAEVRSGPGIQYELADNVLEQGAKVLTFARVGVWQKVVVIGTWQKGWVHSGALSAQAPSAAPLTVDMRRLPTVTVVHDVETVQAYRVANPPLKVAIPRGAQFRSLRLAAADTLVWLPQTNSVMWMSRKDVQ
jgi:SH3-like domain-containing protein